jgi:formylglycine-generating enzyme required for sulfatase activity
MVQATEHAGDVVTMKNGDIHIGHITPATLILNTDFGPLSFHSDAIQGIFILSTSLEARINSRAGEVINGQLIARELQVSRLQSPTIPVDLEDVSQIEFGQHQSNIRLTEYPSRLQTTKGDILNVTLPDGVIRLQTESGIREFRTSGLRYIDISFHTYEEKLLTQLTYQDGSIHQGQPAEENLPLGSAYLARMMVPIAHISRIDLNALDGGKFAAGSFSHSLRRLGQGPQMIKIEGGRFLRGDYQGDGDDDEQPLAEVKLKDYAIGRYEITFDQYDVYCDQTKKCKRPDDQEWGRGDRPVINVSWKEAQSYVSWLADKTGKPYRLPSDAEWEFAHRAGNITRYMWGNEVEFARANCEGCGSLWDGDQSAPTGRFEPNAFGLYDTAGNVFEWVADCYHDRFSEAPVDGSPIEKPDCGKRVIRGGAWSFPPHEVRSANRWRDFPTRRSDDTGFRIAMDLE